MKRRYEKMSDKALKTFAKNNPRIISWVMNGYTVISQGNYFYATTMDISKDLDAIGVTPDPDPSYVRMFLYLLDDRNWDVVTDSYKKLDLPLTDDGKLICQTEEGIGIFDPKLLKELSKFFVSRDLQVFQSVADPSDENSAFFIGLASRDRSEIGVLLHCADGTVSTQDVAKELRSSLLSDIDSALRSRGVDMDSCEKMFTIAVSIRRKRTVAEVTVNTFTELPVASLVSWAIKKSVFYMGFPSRRWEDDMAEFCCKRLGGVASKGFESFDDMVSVLNFPFDAYEQTVFELCLSDYTESVEQIASFLSEVVSSAKTYMSRCLDELKRQLDTDDDYRLLMDEDSIRRDRLRDIGVGMDDFQEFTQNMDVWFPDLKKEHFRRRR